MYEYPYGNSQQLNLDWLLTEWRKFQKAVEDMIAPAWSATESYSWDAPDMVIYNHVLYYCIVEHATVGEFKGDEWQSFTIADVFMGNI